MEPCATLVLVLLIWAGGTQTSATSSTWVRQLWDRITGISAQTTSGSESQLGSHPDAEDLNIFWGIPDASATVGHLFRYQIPHNAFTGKVDRFQVNEAGLSKLPAWLYFNSTSRTFLGVASPLDMGATAIEVQAAARNGNHSVSANFIVTVKANRHVFGSPAEIPRLASHMRYHPDGTPINMEQEPNGVCQLDENTYQAVLILDTAMEKLDAKMRIKLIYRSAQFLSQRIRSIHVGPRKSESITRLMETSTLSAGPGNTGQNKTDVGVELSWIVGCNAFAGSGDLAKILQHNVQVGRFRKELGFQLIGWVITETLPPESLRKLSRQKRQVRGTPMPTPTLPSSIPSQVTDILTVSLLETSLVPELSLSPSSSTASATSLYEQPSMTVGIFSTMVEAKESKSTIDLVSTSFETTSPYTASRFSTGTLSKVSLESGLLSSSSHSFISVFSTPLVSSVSSTEPSVYSFQLTDQATPVLSSSAVPVPARTDELLSTTSLEPSTGTLDAMETLVPSLRVSLTSMSVAQPLSSRTISATDVSDIPLSSILSTPALSVTPVMTSVTSELDSSEFVFSIMSKVLTPTPTYRVESFIVSDIVTSTEVQQGSSEVSISPTKSTSSGPGGMITLSSIVLPPPSTSMKVSSTVKDSSIPSSTPLAEAPSPSLSNTTFLTSESASSVTDQTIVITEALSAISTEVHVIDTVSVTMVESLIERRSSTLALSNSVLSSPVGDITSLVADATSSVPDATSSVHDATSSVPDATSSVPDATSSVPETTSVPATTQSVPDTTSLVTSVIPTLTLSIGSSSDISTNLMSSTGTRPESVTTLPLRTVVPTSSQVMLSQTSISSIVPSPTSTVVNLVSRTPSQGQTLDFVPIGSSVSTKTRELILPTTNATSIVVPETQTALQSRESFNAPTIEPSSTSVLVASSTFEVTSTISTMPSSVFGISPSPSSALTMKSASDHLSSLQSSPILQSSLTMTEYSVISTQVPLPSTSLPSTLHISILTSMAPESRTTSKAWFSSALSTSAVTSSSVALVTSSSVALVTTPPMLNSPPQLIHPIDQINTRLGVYFEYRIPADTFYDHEDGNTLFLELSLFSLIGERLSPASWVQFDANTQTIFGIPLEKDLPVMEADKEFVLVAEDHLGLQAQDALKIIIDASSYDNLTHQFVVMVDEDYPAFISVTYNLIHLITTIARFYGDDLPTKMTVTNVTGGLVKVHWSNNTLSRAKCENETVERLFERLSGGGKVNPDFRRATFPRYNILDVGLRYEGVCLPPLPLPPPSPSPTAPIFGATTDSSIFYKTIIPAVIIALILLVAVLVCICLQRRRRLAGRLLLDDEKPIFVHDRHPVLLEDEFEMHELNRSKPHRPLVMTHDGAYANAAFHIPATYHAPARPPPYRVPGQYGLFFDEDEFDGASISPPPDYVSEASAGVYNRPPPSYRLPPPYTSQPAASDA